MTLPLNSRLSALYDTNGTQKDFSFGFRVFFDPDNGGYGLEVRRQTADGYEVIPKSDYLVLPVEDNSAGVVRFSVAPSAGQQIYIAGKTPTIQQLVLTNFGRYSAESIETQFDFITAIIQEWLSALGEETRQRIAADEILTQYVVQRIDDFVQQVNQNWDDKSQEIEDYIATIMPSFTQTLREEIEAFAVAGMQDAIDQTLAESKAEIDDAVARANAAALAAAITGKVYDTPEAGVDPVTGVQNGAYYNVRSPDNDSYLVEYQNIGGVPTPSGKSYPSSSYVQLVADQVDDIAEFTALPFVIGESYKVNQRVQLNNGDIVVNTIPENTSNPNVDMAGWANPEADQKLFNSRTQRTIQSFGAVSGQDCTQALLDAAAWSRTNKQPVYDFIGGNYKFSQQLDFSVNGAGLVGAGPYVTTLTWQGAENTTPIVSDQGGKHPVFQLTNKTGAFKWGELVTGARGGKGIVRSFPWEPLQVQTTFGDFAPAEVVTGSKSSASGLIMGISALSFGASVQSVNVRGFNLVADFERTTDQFNNPTKWFQSCGIYINGARNHSKIGDLVVDGFEFGLYSRMNWMCEYTDTILTVNCKNGIIFDYETNNIKLGVLSVRRGGNAADVNEGVGVQFTGSYSFIASNPIDVEASYCRGIVVEACHGVGLYGGDIENNDKSVRKIIIKGYEGSDFANDSKAWTRGINLFGMRVHNCLGIQLENGAKQVTIGGNAFSWTTTGTPTGAFALTVASGHTHIKDICYLETNDIFGQNETLLPNIPFSMQSTTMLAKELNKYHSIEAEISTTDVDRIIPIGRFPTNVSVNRVEVIQDTDLTGTAIIDVGAGGTLLAIVNTFNFTPVATASTPFGYQNMPLVTTIVNRGASVAHVRIRSGSTLSAGKLKIKIYYSLNF